jgi:disulfide bond formation protein DsbB
MNQYKLHRIGNLIGLIILCIILSIAFIDQLTRNDLPCPLCLLQRVCFAAIGICFCMNIKNGIKASHYGFMSLSAYLGLALATRQIYLHLAPGDPGYGQLVFGIHMYVWSLIAFTTVMLTIASALLFERGFSETPPKPKQGHLALMILFLFLILANGVSTFIECGFLVCSDNPSHYAL